MAYQPDPDTICTCGHFYGIGVEHANDRVAHRWSGKGCLVEGCDCRKFTEDTHATFANWCAENATW